MPTIDQLKEYRNKYNRFAMILGARVTDMQEGYAKCEMPVKKDFYNPNNSVHGGVIFSIADIAAGAAAASYGMRMTTMDASLSFLAPALTSKMLYGEGREIKRGKSVCVYDVWITDDQGVLIAKGTYTFFSLNTPITLDEMGVPGIEEHAQEKSARVKVSLITDHQKGGVQPRA